jgi:hypothetical protein
VIRRIVLFAPLEGVALEEFEAAVRRLEGLDQQLDDISGWELSIDMDALTEWKGRSGGDVCRRRHNGALCGASCAR